MATVDETGFNKKTQNEYFTDERDRYLAIDPAWNLDPSSPDGLKLATDSELWANLDEALLAAFNSKDPDRATRADLDALLELSFIQRQQGYGSTATLTVSGVSGTLIPAGSRVRSSVDKSTWETDTDITIGLGGSANVYVTNQAVGATPADPGTITVIGDPVGGWQSAANQAPAVLGTPVESDALARIRRRASVANAGKNQVDTTFAAVANVPGVTHLRIYENREGTTNANGLPPHSTDVIVNGSDDAAIAQAIYDNRNAGPPQHQSATPVDVTVTSAVTGNTMTIKFDRPLYLDIAVIVSVTDDGSLPGNAAELISAAILSYSIGEIDGVSGAFNQSGFSIGEDVFSSQLYTPVNSVIGQYGNSSISSLTVNAGQSVAIPFNSLSRWSAAGITVNIT